MYRAASPLGAGFPALDATTCMRRRRRLCCRTLRGMPDGQATRRRTRQDLAHDLRQACSAPRMGCRGRGCRGRSCKGMRLCRSRRYSSRNSNRSTSLRSRGTPAQSWGPTHSWACSMRAETCSALQPAHTCGRGLEHYDSATRRSGSESSIRANSEHSCFGAGPYGANSRLQMTQDCRRQAVVDAAVQWQSRHTPAVAVDAGVRIRARAACCR